MSVANGNSLHSLVVRLSDSVTLIHGNCLECLPIEADAVISDPPYGIGYFHSGGGGASSKLSGGPANTARAKSWSGKTAMIKNDDTPFDPAPWLKYPVVCLFGANHYSDALPRSAKWLIWDKIVVPETYGKFSFADCEMAWTNAKGTARIYKHMWQGCRRAGESNKEGKLHPNQKPIMLLQWVMEQTGVPSGATVLDPYMGSGTTGIACIRTGRKFIGIEIDAGHFATARARLENELRQGLLPLTHNAESEVSQ
jgi:site-specific DNA-methyltransferase (adenine-specific)